MTTKMSALAAYRTGKLTLPNGYAIEHGADVLLLRRGDGSVVAAGDRGIRREADKVLVEATRWLKYHPKDAVIISAREQLRATFPPGS
jgi:hypothetical protein